MKSRRADCFAEILFAAGPYGGGSQPLSQTQDSVTSVGWETGMGSQGDALCLSQSIYCTQPPLSHHQPHQQQPQPRGKLRPPVLGGSHALYGTSLPPHHHHHHQPNRRHSSPLHASTQPLPIHSGNPGTQHPQATASPYSRVSINTPLLPQLPD